MAVDTVSLNYQLAKVEEPAIDPPPDRHFVQLIRYAPIVFITLMGAALAFPGTRDFVLPQMHTDSAVREGQIVEIASFLFLAVAGVAGLVLAFRLAASRFEQGFFLLFSLAMLFIAGEEISWGQWIYSYATPDWMTEINGQGEMTVHNIGPFQGRSEIFRLAFALAGMVGLFPLLSWLRPVRVPKCLGPTLFAILALAIVDTAGDLGLLGEQVEYLVTRLAEAVELMIAFTGFAYIALHIRARRRTSHAH